MFNDVKLSNTIEVSIRDELIDDRKKSISVKMNKTLFVIYKKKRYNHSL